MTDANPTTVQPYLFLGGKTEEALAFYGSAIGAKTTRIMRFNESPSPPPPGTLAPGFENKVMHADFTVGGSTILASDGCDPGTHPSGFSLVLSVASDGEAERAFARLAEGGKVNMPIGKTFFASRYGMLTDKFGVDWMVMTAQAQRPQ